MGITGLLPQLKSVTKTISIGELEGKRVAVDANVWIHKGTYACAVDLVLGKPTDVYVMYCRKMCLKLREFGIFPVLVFDGHALPAKAITSRQREGNRASARRKLDENIDALHRLEAWAMSTPYDVALQSDLGVARVAVERAAQTAVEVTADMVERVISVCGALEGVEVLRAPYEADAQLAYLARERLIDAVLTEDSDLVVHACPKVLYKFDPHSATAQQLLWKDVLAMEATPKSKLSLSKFSLKGFTKQKFMHMCLLVGADYLEGIKGIGMIKANELISKFGHGLRVVEHLKANGTKGIKVPDGYEQKFREAEVPSAAQRDRLMSASIPVPHEHG